MPRKVQLAGLCLKEDMAGLCLKAHMAGLCLKADMAGLCLKADMAGLEQIAYHSNVLWPMWSVHYTYHGPWPMGYSNGLWAIPVAYR